MGNKIRKNHFQGGSNLQQGGQNEKDQGLADLIREGQFEVLTFTSDAGGGGAAFEVMTLTGLKATDTILGVSQSVKSGPCGLGHYL